MEYDSGILKNERGASAVFVALCLLMFISFAALAIDLGHLYVVRNELQNAADAGALAGAASLYDPVSGNVNPGANAIGHEVAENNTSEKSAVEVNWSGGNTGDVQRGHWRFATKTFTENDSLLPVDLWDVTAEQLDLNTDFINAVKVTARREALPIASFLARIFGFNSFTMNMDAVAYIGFAGVIYPGEADQPIAICKQAITNPDGSFTCTRGRMINSGNNPGHESAGWTNFTQPCVTANPPTLRPLICGSGNPVTISLGEGMGTTGGMDQNVYDDLLDCWLQAGLDSNGDGFPDKPWKMTLPVIDCDSNNVSPCSTVLGSVEVELLWITRTGDKTKFEKVPRAMEGWTCTDPDGQVCWQSFVNHFNLLDIDGSPAIYNDKAIYYKPGCEPQVPTGRTGGTNFGVLAKYPVLVE